MFLLMLEGGFKPKISERTPFCYATFQYIHLHSRNHSSIVWPQFSRSMASFIKSFPHAKVVITVYLPSCRTVLEDRSRMFYCLDIRPKRRQREAQLSGLCLNFCLSLLHNSLETPHLWFCFIFICKSHDTSYTFKFSLQANEVKAVCFAVTCLIFFIQ